MSKTEIVQGTVCERNGTIRIVAVKDIPLVITVDPVTGDDTWHPPKKVGDEFNFPEKNAMVLIRRGLASELNG